MVEAITFPTTTNPVISIVIPVYNKWQYSANCLYSIFKNTQSDYEVLIVDDASSDETQKELSTIKNLRFVQNEKNLGFIDTCNHGAQVSRGDYILFLNNDTMVTPNWLQPLLEIIKKDSVGAVGSKLVFPNGSLQEAGGLIWNDGTGWNYGRGDNPDKPQYNYVKEVDYCTGACLLVKRDLFETIGGFDIRYRPGYFEESDMCFSIRKLGFKVIYQPLSVVVHFEGITNGTNISSGIKKYQEINRPKFVDKWKDVLLTDHLKNDPNNAFLARDRSMGKKILLMIDDKLPEYDRHAGGLTTYQYIKLFLDMGYKIIFIPDNYFRTEPYTTELQQLGVEVIYGPFDFNSWLTAFGKYLDVIWLSRPHISIKYIDKFKGKTRAQILYYMHDLHYLREQRRYEISKNIGALKESERLKLMEFKIFKAADIILTPSISEKNILTPQLPGKIIEAIPAYMYDNLTPFEQIARFKSRKDIIFLGGFGHLPNVDGVLWFSKQILPYLLSAIPDLKFIIAGTNPTPEIEKLASNNIVVTGYVKDLSPIFSKVKVFVSPLRYGAGVKGKIITSMSYGVPVVTTTIGSEGIALTHGENTIIVDEADKFAQAVLELYSDELLWNKLSENSISFIQNNFSVKSARSNILRILNVKTEQ